MIEGAIDVALLPLHGGELAIEHGAVRRAGNRRGVGGDRFVEPARARRLPRARQLLLEHAKRQHFDAGPHVGERRIGRERRLERGQRFRFAAKREERLRTAEKRGDLGLLALERAIEVRERGFRVLPRQLDVAE